MFVGEAPTGLTIRRGLFYGYMQTTDVIAATTPNARNDPANLEISQQELPERYSTAVVIRNKSDQLVGAMTMNVQTDIAKRTRTGILGIGGINWNNNRYPEVFLDGEALLLHHLLRTGKIIERQLQIPSKLTMYGVRNARYNNSLPAPEIGKEKTLILPGTVILDPIQKRSDWNEKMKDIRITRFTGAVRTLMKMSDFPRGYQAFVQGKWMGCASPYDDPSGRRIGIRYYNTNREITGASESGPFDGISSLLRLLNPQLR